MYEDPHGVETRGTRVRKTRRKNLLDSRGKFVGIDKVEEDQ